MHGKQLHWHWLDSTSGPVIDNQIVYILGFAKSVQCYNNRWTEHKGGSQDETTEEEV